MPRWKLTVALTVAGSLVGGAIEEGAWADPGTSPETFKRHAKRAADSKRATVCRWGQLRYQGKGNKPGYFAVMAAKTDAGPQQPEWLLLGRGSVERWGGPDDTYSWDGGCGESDLRWEDLPKLEINLSGGASYRFDRSAVTCIEGEFVLLSQEDGNVDGHEETSWEEARRRSQDRDDRTGGPLNERSAGLIVVLPPESPWLARWRTPTFVSFGAKNRRNRADADLAVKAIEPTPGTVRILIDIKDDHVVPVGAGADDTKFLRGDHLELWWEHAGAAAERGGTRQLGIGLLSDGGVDVRWLIPPASRPEELPVVRRSGTHLEVDFSVGRLTSRDQPSTGAGWRAAFTVAFSDADDPAAGQQTVVATSTLRWHREDTFGELVRFDSLVRRFPPF